MTSLLFDQTSPPVVDLSCMLYIVVCYTKREGI